jgi:hypothetical protein
MKSTEGPYKEYSARAIRRKYPNPLQEDSGFYNGQCNRVESGTKLENLFTVSRRILSDGTGRITC